MIVGFDEITLEDLSHITNAVIDGNKRTVLIGAK